MREIRFRAWFCGKMHDDVVLIDFWHCLEKKNLGCPLNDGIKDFLSHDDPSSPMVLMQYTGLKDKNGREIYEGDIVRVFRSDSFKAYDAGVYFVSGGFFTEWYNPIDKEKKAQPIHDYPVEVIGNIYEHPELMEGVK